MCLQEIGGKENIWVGYRFEILVWVIFQATASSWSGRQLSDEGLAKLTLSECRSLTSYYTRTANITGRKKHKYRANT